MKNTIEKDLQCTGLKPSNTKMLEQCKSPDMWTLLVEDFHAKTFPLQEAWKELTEAEADCGAKCLEFVGTLDLSTSSLKIAQLSLLEDSSECFATFPKSGIMRNGSVYRTSLLDTHTAERESTLLPTPTKSDHKSTFAKVEVLTRYLKSGHQLRAMDILAQKGFLKSQRIAILEMMMGFEIGHTELPALEIP